MRLEKACRAFIRSRWVCSAMAVCIASGAWMIPAAASSIPYPLTFFKLVNSNADGTLLSDDGGITAELTGGNNGSGLGGTTDLVGIALGPATIRFHFAYHSLDLPTYDWAGYFIGSDFTQLADTDGLDGIVLFSVATGDSFGFRVGTEDNVGEPGRLVLSDFVPGTPAVPETVTVPFALAVAVGLAGLRRRYRPLRHFGKERQ